MSKTVKTEAAAAARLAAAGGDNSTKEFVQRLWGQLGLTDSCPNEKMPLFITGAFRPAMYIAFDSMMRVYRFE